LRPRIRTARSRDLAERWARRPASAQLDAGEITDKGYVNQRCALQRRAAEVARLLDEPADPAVIVPAEH
jgi:hypothetical protein